MENKVWFVEPTGLHNNFGIMATGAKNFIKRIDRIMARDCTCPFTNDPNREEKRSWGSFHQGSSPDWTYWEFWADQTPEFRAKVEAKVASILEEMKTPDEWAWMDE